MTESSSTLANQLGLGKMIANIGSTFVRRMVALIVGLAHFTLLARTLDAEGVGIYNIVLFLPQVLLTVLNLGIEPATIYLVGGNKRLFRKAYSAGLVIWFTVSCAGIIVTVPIVYFYAEMLFPGVSTQYLWISLIIYPVILLRLFLLGLLRAVQDFDRFNIVSLVIPTITLILVLIAVTLLKYGLVGALIAYNIGQLFGVLISWWSIREHLAEIPDTDTGNLLRFIKEAIQYGWKANLSNIVSFANYRIDIYLINLLINPASVGIYYAAVRLVEILWHPSNAASTILMPRIAELKNERLAQAQITPVVVRGTIVVTIMVAVLLGIVALPFFVFIGASFKASYPVFLILIPGAILAGMSNVLMQDLAARNRVDLNVYATLSALITEVGLIFLLSPKFELKGIAIATGLGYTLEAFVVTYFYTRVSGVKWKEIILLNELDIEMVKKIWKVIKTYLQFPDSQ